MRQHNHLITITTLLFLIISITAQDDPEMDTKTLHIAPYQQNCIGEAPQDCMVIRWDDETDLSLFYDAIDGFEFEEGYEYTLLVNVTERENVPADASSLQYELVEVVQKYPAQLDGKVWELHLSIFDREHDAARRMGDGRCLRVRRGHGRPRDAPAAPRADFAGKRTRALAGRGRRRPQRSGLRRSGKPCTKECDAHHLCRVAAALCRAGV